jgi:chloramphenicol O-acetyltransferase
MLETLKSKLWIVTIPVAIIVLLSISALKDIEKAQADLDNGKRTAYFLRSSTDSLTYLSAAYTATGNIKFLNQFNDHLDRRKGMRFIIDEDALIYYNEGLRISNLLATEIETPAFKQMDSKAFFTEKYLDYKTQIINSIEKLRDTVTKKSNDKLKKSVLELNIYIYTLIFLILGLIAFIRFSDSTATKKQKTPVTAKKKPIKKKPTTKKIKKSK